MTDSKSSNVSITVEKSGKIIFLAPLTLTEILDEDDNT